MSLHDDRRSVAGVHIVVLMGERRAVAVPTVILFLLPDSSCPTGDFSASWRVCIYFMEIWVV